MHFYVKVLRQTDPDWGLTSPQGAHIPPGGSHPQGPSLEGIWGDETPAVGAAPRRWGKNGDGSCMHRRSQGRCRVAGASPRATKKNFLGFFCWNQAKMGLNLVRYAPPQMTKRHLVAVGLHDAYNHVKEGDG